MYRLTVGLGMALVIGGPAVAQWTAVEEAKLVPGSVAPSDLFGASLAIDQDTLVVGAAGTQLGAGAVYVFTRAGSVWTESQQLAPPNPTLAEAFGTSVAIDAGRILVGAPIRNAAGIGNSGAADVFEWNGTTWVHTQELTAPAPKLNGSFGRAVAIAGSRALCGAPNGNDVFAFLAGPGSWSFQASLPYVPVGSGNQFGSAISMDGDRAVVGAPKGWAGLGGSKCGSGTIYSWTGSAWTYEDTIGPRPTGPTGYNMEGYGTSVALSGDFALGGAPGFLTPSWPKSAGAAHVHERGGAKWVWRTALTKAIPLFGEEYGDAVAIDGNLVAVGAPGGKKGLVLVHSRSGSTWKKVAKLKASDGADHDRFGDTLALEDRRVFVGAPLHDPGGLEEAGAVYVYLLVPPPPKTYCTAGTSASGCTASLGWSGTPSASAMSGFVISAAGVEGGRSGMLIYGTGGQQALAWGGGTSYLCITPPLMYGGVLGGAGTLGACDGSFAVDLNALWCAACPKASTNPDAGATVQGQLWYRDPLNTSNLTTSLSDAIEFVVGP